MYLLQEITTRRKIGLVNYINNYWAAFSLNRLETCKNNLRAPTYGRPNGILIDGHGNYMYLHRSPSNKCPSREELVPC